MTVLVPTYGYDSLRENINFKENATNWSIGLLYKVTPSLSVFARASHGTRFAADRLTRSTARFVVFSPMARLTRRASPQRGLRSISTNSA